MQCASTIFLIRPASFIYNNETAGSNAFQNKTGLTDVDANRKAAEEFQAFADKLKSKGVNVLVFDDTAHPQKPDAVFPNNWVSLHADGTVVLYPLFAPNRRLERRHDIVEALKKKFKVSRVIDLSKHEKETKFLEGTGSIVFDHVNKIAYACLSPRTHKELFIQLCEQLSYQPIYFHAHDPSGKEIYHTNVMMCVAEKFVVICLDSIADKVERKMMVRSFAQTEHEVIDISFGQMNRFTGNMLALQTNDNKNILALSQSSFDSLSGTQKQQIEKYCELVPLSIPTIETIGGGSARCMIAEVFLTSVF